jgi:chromate transporter
MSIGLARAGAAGMFAAWIAFSLPSALILVAAAYGLNALGDPGAGWIAGLKAAVVAVVANAIWAMIRMLASDRERATIAILATAAAASMPGVLAQIGIIVAGGLAGLLLPQNEAARPPEDRVLIVPRRIALACLGGYFALLAMLPLLASLTGDPALDIIDRFYRAGALVFGGGHVILPLLEAEVVAPGLVSHEDFLAGYGVTQALPGPLFTFPAFLGAVMVAPPNGMYGAALALVAAFLPSFFLVPGAMAFWDGVRGHPAAQRALAGVGAAVVGLLGAAFWDPVIAQGLTSLPTFVIALMAFLLLTVWRVPVWAVVGLAALAGGALA